MLEIAPTFFCFRTSINDRHMDCAVPLPVSFRVTTAPLESARRSACQCCKSMSYGMTKREISLISSSQECVGIMDFMSYTYLQDWHHGAVGMA